MFDFIGKEMYYIGKGSFIIYDADLEGLDYLTDIQAGKLFKAIRNYRLTDDATFVSKNPAVNILYKQITGHISLNEEKYKALCKQNSEFAKKRWSKNKKAPADANACERIPTDTHACLNDNVNENDNEYDNDNVNEPCGAKKENKRNNYYGRKNTFPSSLRDEPSYDADAFMRKAIGLKYQKPESQQ